MCVTVHDSNWWTLPGVRQLNFIDPRVTNPDPRVFGNFCSIGEKDLKRLDIQKCIPNMLQTRLGTTNGMMFVSQAKEARTLDIRPSLPAVVLQGK